MSPATAPLYGVGGEEKAGPRDEYIHEYNLLLTSTGGRQYIQPVYESACDLRDLLTLVISIAFTIVVIIIVLQVPAQRLAHRDLVERLSNFRQFPRLCLFKSRVSLMSRVHFHFGGSLACLPESTLPIAGACKDV